MKRGYALISNHRANSSLQSAETLHAPGMTDNVKARWWRGHQQFLYCQSAASERAVLMSAVTKTVRMALQSLMLGLGCWLAILGDISPGMMIAGSILLGRALSPVEQLISVAKGYRSARLAWERVVRLTGDFPRRRRAFACQLRRECSRLRMSPFSLRKPPATHTAKHHSAGKPG